MATTTHQTEIRLLSAAELEERQNAWRQFLRREDLLGYPSDPRWLTVLGDALRHVPYLVEATRGDRVAGLLPLALVKSLLFGRFLVSLPYVNSAGVVAEDEAVALALIDRAVALAEELDVRYLELRHETHFAHPALGQQLTSKVHMRLELPPAADALWKSFKPKVRNQIRKGESNGLTIHWGAAERLPEFYDVFSRNMRDLGTPVFGRALFERILALFPGEAELCVVRLADRPIAAALLVHSPGMTQVPSASSLRQFNSTNANMLLYWHLLQRAIERGQGVFDFGRSSQDSSTFRFKKQWGATPHAAVWQYDVRKGSVGDMRPESSKYGRFIRLWQRLPVGLTRLVGPTIVRGIP